MVVIFAVPEMRAVHRSLVVLALALSLGSCRRAASPSLALGAAAPDFALPGADGRVHSLRDYSDRRVLAVVFTCNTCPASQLYERRIQALHDDYRGKGVAVVAINPNQPAAMQPADLAQSDAGETLEDMKTRAAHRRISYPYLSDGDTQAVSRQFGVVVTPHIFVFDQARRLVYQGRIDDNAREDLAGSRDARNAIDAVLSGQPVPVAHTRVAGCPVRGLPAQAGPAPSPAAPESAAVSVEMAGAEDLKRLRQNGTGKLLMINFWATWCAPCAAEFPELEAAYRDYKGRGLEFTTVSVNDPEERAAVLEFLQQHRASHRNLQFATADVYGLQAAFDPKLPAPVPLTLLLAPNGDVVYQELGELTVTRLRRAILANLPDDPHHPGHQAYWAQP